MISLWCPLFSDLERLLLSKVFVDPLVEIEY